MEFTERTELEKGFAPVFHAQVRPQLMELEDHRVARLAKAKKWVAIALGIMVILMGVVWLIWGGSEGAFFGYFFIGLLGVIGAGVSWAIQASSWTSSVAEAVMPAICDHVGELSYDRDANGPFPVGDMRSLGLLPSYDSSDRDNRLEGIHRSTAYEMMQVTLKRRSRDSKGNTKTNTVFSGLLFHITVPIEVPGQIVMMRDRGGFGNKLGEMFAFGGARSMPKVSFDHDEFEDAFEVYASDPEAARQFMPRPFLDNLLAIGEEEGGRKGAKAMVAGFEGKSFYLALRRGGAFMRMGKLTTPVAEMEEDLHAIFHDIELSHRIIDKLHGV